MENATDHQFVVEKRSKSAIAGNGAGKLHSRNSTAVCGPKSIIPSTPQGGANANL